MTCIRLDYDLDFDIFTMWLKENVGIFGRDLDWVWAPRRDGYSVIIRDPQKATLVALRWGAK